MMHPPNEQQRERSHHHHFGHFGRSRHANANTSSAEFNSANVVGANVNPVHGAAAGVPFPAHTNAGPGPWPKHDAASAAASGPLHHSQHPHAHGSHGSHGALNNSHHPVQYYNPLQQHPPNLSPNHNHMEPRRGSHGHPHGRTSPAITSSAPEQHSLHSQQPQRTQYARAMNHHRPVPLALPNRTPASPRWDSIDARSRNVSPVPPSPFQQQHITSQRSRAESTTPTGTPRLTPRSVFPGLSSHPFIPEALEPEDSDENQQQQDRDHQDRDHQRYSQQSQQQIPEEPEPSPSRPFSRKFPLIGRGSQQIDDEVMRRSPVPLTPTSPTHSYTSSIAHSRQPTTDTVMVVENFSRPRKTSTSIRSKNSNISVIRAAPPIRHQHEPSFDSLHHHHANNHLTQQQQQYNNENIAPNQPSWPQDHRRFSTASSHSSSTFSSSIAKRPSNDQLQNAARDQLQQQQQPPPPVMRRPFPAHPVGVSGLPARPAPPVSYNNYNNFYPPAAREPPAWIHEEFRPPSFRSPFATNSGERCSILTTHSITEQSIINGYARASWRTNSIADDGPSIEDVMVMYERGFNDSEIESIGFRKSRRFLDDTDHYDPDLGVFPLGESSRPATSHSDPDTDRTTKIFEAMDDEPLPLPGARPLSRKSARQSAFNARKSGLQNSLPKDIGLAISEDMERKRQQSITEFMEKQRQESVSEEAVERRRQESDAKDPAKHDSAKLMDGDNVIDLQAQEAVASGPLPTAPTDSMESMEPMETPDQTPDHDDAQEEDEEEEQYRAILTPIPTANMPVEPPEEPGSRDRYGFRKASANITRQQYDAWDAQYSEYLARRRRKWIAFLKDNSLMTDRPNRFPPRSTKTKRFIRKGIPPDWRGAAWFYYAGGPALLSKHRGVYDDLVRRAGLDPKGPGKLPGARGEVKPLICEDIEKDLHRTFPDNIRFKPPQSQSTTPGGDSQAAGGHIPGVTQPADPRQEPDIISALRRVLHAFALYNPRIGYCQSLNFLAGLLLLFVETEEQAFWLLNVITRVYLPGTHEMSLEGSKVDLGVLMGTLKDSLPNVWKQIGGDELEANTSKRHRLGNRVRHGGKNLSISDPNRLPAITLCMTAWFMSCFIGTLPIETVLRVWDVFFYEGSRTLFRIALTIFKLGENEIRAVQDPMEMFGVVQAFPRRLIDCNMLMDACYKRRNGIGHLTQEAVEEKRQERRDNIQKWRALQEAASEAGPRLNTAAHVGNPASRSVAGGLDLTGDDRKGSTLFSRRGRGDREQARADEVM